jgi:hypothetical protein
MSIRDHAQNSPILDDMMGTGCLCVCVAARLCSEGLVREIVGQANNSCSEIISYLGEK